MRTGSVHGRMHGRTGHAQVMYRSHEVKSRMEELNRYAYLDGGNETDTTTNNNFPKDDPEPLPTIRTSSSALEKNDKPVQDTGFGNHAAADTGRTSHSEVP
jgi:hypothetical protein